MFDLELLKDENELEVISNSVEFTYVNDEITDKVDFVENSSFSTKVFA